MGKDKKTTRIVRVVAFGLVFSGVLLSFPVYASETFRTQLMGETREVFMTLLSIARLCAVVCIAVSAIQMMFAFGPQNQHAQKMDKAATHLIYAVIALVALYLLPAVVQLGVEVGRTVSWNPDPSAW